VAAGTSATTLSRLTSTLPAPAFTILGGHFEQITVAHSLAAPENDVLRPKRLAKWVNNILISYIDAQKYADLRE